jgi:NAD(P)-dependent dehydrogenase (short-subunit alcohol dehydrogenase family)
LEKKMYEGKVVLVTGTTSGMGRTTALAFAREGAKVITAARREDRGAEVLAQIKAEGGEAIWVRTDIRKPEEIDNLFKTIMATYGRLDIAYNNAGVSVPHNPPTYKTTVEEWDDVHVTNVRGTWLCMQHEIDIMLKQGGGVILNTSSMLGVTADYGLSQYCSSKHAILGLTKTAALEFAPKGIRINAICPGPIDTEMVQKSAQYVKNLTEIMASNTPLFRIGKPEEITTAVLWLCSDEASYMVGKELLVDGGKTI